MRKFWLLAVPILLLAVAVSGETSKPSPVVAACPAASASALGQVLPEGQPAPLFATNYLCGTCSHECSGLLTGSPCTQGCGSSGICLGIVSPGGQRAQCLPGTGTGYACNCSDTCNPE